MGARGGRDDVSTTSLPPVLSLLHAEWNINSLRGCRSRWSSWIAFYRTCFILTVVWYFKVTPTLLVLTSSQREIWVLRWIQNYHNCIRTNNLEVTFFPWRGFELFILVDIQIISTIGLQNKVARPNALFIYKHLIHHQIVD